MTYTKANHTLSYSCATQSCFLSWIFVCAPPKASSKSEGSPLQRPENVPKKPEDKNASRPTRPAVSPPSLKHCQHSFHASNGVKTAYLFFFLSPLSLFSYNTNYSFVWCVRLLTNPMVGVVGGTSKGDAVRLLNEITQSRLCYACTTAALIALYSKIGLCLKSPLEEPKRLLQCDRPHSAASLSVLVIDCTGRVNTMST